MKSICFIKEFSYWHPTKMYLARFEKNGRYKLPEIYAEWFIEQGYAFEYGYVEDLPLTLSSSKSNTKQHLTTQEVQT